jgi:DNA-binding transcriptional regulator YdaS (Cro superfamily)
MVGPMPKKTFSDLIHERDHTFRSFGEKVGFSHSYLCRVANGHRRLTLERASVFARALKISIDELNQSLPKRQG